MSALRAVEEPRHVCNACGACCQGVRVRVLGEEEEVRVQALAARLGVPDPLEDGRLRFVDGHCVFLDADRLCRLHRHFGAAAKPHLCRQYPAVVLNTESDTRIGIDPGCFSSWSSWREGDLLAANAQMVPNAVVLDPNQAAAERAFLALARRPGATVAQLLADVLDLPPGPDGALPCGLAGRWVATLQQARLQRLLLLPDTGAPVREALLPLTRASWDPACPPPWPVLSEEQEAFVLSVARRMVFLRLTARLPTVQLGATLVLLGAVSAAWLDPAPQVFPRTYAAWLRAIRAPVFWSALLPSPGDFRALAQGAA